MATSTVKNILTENRDSIISSIKWVNQVYDQESIKSLMHEFYNWAIANEDRIIEAANARNTKTRLKTFVQKLAAKRHTAAKEQKDIELYGTANPKLEDIMAANELKQQENGNIWHPIHKTWVKNEGVNPAMQKNPKFS